MDPSSAVGSVLSAIGLSGAAGANPWLPVFLSALLDRLGVVDLAAPFDALSSTPGLIVPGALLAVDFVGDKIPAVDHALHGAGVVIAPVAGAVLAVGQTGEHSDVPTAVAAASGGSVAGGVHLLRAGVRPLSTAFTGGIGNPVLSLIEDGFSAVLTVMAFVVPLLAALALIAAVTAGLLLVLQARKRRRRE